MTSYATGRRALAVDANILIRGVLGERVFELLETYAEQMVLVAPELAFASMHGRVPEILAKRGIGAHAAAALVEARGLPFLVSPVPEPYYRAHEAEARRRMARRDEADWPFLALSLAFSCPLWTEDRDFFGTGIPIWTTDLVEIYLAEGDEPLRLG